MDPADTKAPPVASFSINRFGARVMLDDFSESDMKHTADSSKLADILCSKKNLTVESSYPKCTFSFYQLLLLARLLLWDKVSGHKLILNL